MVTPSLPLYASVNIGPPLTLGPVVAQVGQTASGYSTTLLVDTTAPTAALVTNCMAAATAPSCAGTLQNMYQCPPNTPLGGGAWGYYGCQSQIQSQPTCYEIEFPTSMTFPCTYVGKMCLVP